MSLADRVKRRLEALDLTPAEASRKAGRAPTFVRDILKARKSSVRGDSAKALADALGTTVEWLLEGRGEETPHRGAILVDTSPIRHILTLATLETGIWGGGAPDMAELSSAERAFDSKDDVIAVAVPDHLRGADLAAFRVGDLSMNHFYPLGAVIIAQSIEGDDLREGDHVIAEAESDGRFELTCRELVRLRGGQWGLRPRSTEAAFSDLVSPIDDHVRLVAVVVGAHVFRDRPAKAPAALTKRRRTKK